MLDRKHISYNVIDVFEDPEARKLVEDTGKLEMPYVRVMDGDELITEWHGFRYNKILELTKTS